MNKPGTEHQILSLKKYDNENRKERKKAYDYRFYVINKG